MDNWFAVRGGGSSIIKGPFSREKAEEACRVIAADYGNASLMKCVAECHPLPVEVRWENFDDV